MKRHFRRILSFIMMICILSTLLPVETISVFAKSYTTNSVDKSIDELLDNYQNKADSFDYIQYLGMHYTSSSISNQIYSSMEMDKLSSSLVDDMLGNSLFVEGYSAWIASGLVSNLAGIVEYLSRKTYYETIIFKILQSNMEVDTVIDWMNQKCIKDAMKLNKSLTGLADQKIYKYVVDNYDLSKLNEGELKELEKIVKNHVSVQKYNITGGSVEFVSDILKISKNVEDFIKNTASYLLLADVSDSTVAFLKELRSHSTNKDLTESLDDVIAICEDSFKDLLEKVVVEKFFFSTGKEMLKEVLGKQWKSMLISKLTGGVLSNGYYFVNGVLIGNALGRTITDIAFSINSKLDKFELMRSLSVFENVLENTLREDIALYDNTEASAQSLFSGVDLLYKTYEYDSDLFIEMIKISEKDWIAPLYGDQFTETITYANAVKSYYQGIYDKITISSGLCGNTVGWILLDDGSLLIYGTGNMNDYSAEKAPWYGEREKIKEIYISTGITRIGNYAFNNLINANNIIVLTSSVECGSNCFDLLGEKAEIVSLNNMRFSGTHDIANDIDIIGNLYCCTTQETHVNIRDGVTVNVNGDAEFVTSPVYISVKNSSIDINDGAILNVNGNMKVSGSSHPSSNWSFHWLSFYINGEVTVGGDFSTGIKTYLYEQNSSGYLKIQGNFSQTDSEGEISAGTIKINGNYNGKFTASGDNTVILSGDKRQTITGLKAKNLVIKNTSKEGVNFNGISYCTGGVDSKISKIENGKNLYLSGGYFIDTIYLGDITLEKNISIANDIDIIGNLYCCTTQETHVDIRDGVTVNVNGDAEFVTSPVYISVKNSSIDINDGAILNVNGNMKVSGSSHPSSNWSFHWLSFYINGEVTVGGDFSTGIKTYLYEQNSSGYLKIQGNFSQTDSMGELLAGTIEIDGNYEGKFTASGSHTVILSGTTGQTVNGLKAKNLVISNFSEDGIAFSNIPSNKLQFTVLCPNGYSKTSNYAVKADGLEIEPNGNNEYITETKSKTVITIEGIADITAPSAEIWIDEYQWSDFIDNISFDRFFSKGKDVIISANDLGSGVHQIYYYMSHKPISKDNIANIKDWAEYKDGIHINADNEWIIYIKVSDNAGNTKYYSSDGIVLDSAAPIISGIENAKTYCEPQVITIEEPYLDSVIINGVSVSVGEGNTILIPADGKQEIFVSDKAGNSAEISVTINDGHTGGKATCNELAKCTVCGKPYGTFRDHKYIEYAEAKYLMSNATCIAKAKYYKSCSICGAIGLETFESGDINTDNHVGDTYIENQKEATCYKEGYTGDKYCSDCHAKIESGTVIPINAHNPASVWSTDDTHHWKECQTVGCGNIIDKAEHSGGEATCKDRAICSTCGVEYGDINADNHTGTTEIKDVVEPTCTTDGYTGNTYCKDCGVKIKEGEVIPAAHTLQKVDAKAATHDVDGNIEYYVCTVCGRYFSDETAADELTYDDTIIAKGKHDYIEKYDSVNHWKECECGSITDMEKHIFGNWGVTKPATCTTLGEEEGTCSCGAKATRLTTDFGDHQYIEKADVRYLVSLATCISSAKYYKICSVCGAKGEETFEGGDVNAGNHVGDTYLENQKEATCYEEGYTGDTKCSSCDATITSGKVIPKNAHNPSDVWSTNDTHHWKECQTVGCGNIIDKAEHSGGEATCTEKAICSVCHVQYGNLNPDNHKNTEIRNATEPSCNQDGYSGDIWCLDCQKQISIGHSIPSTGKHVDADGKWESNDTQHFHTCACGVEFDQENHRDGEATCHTQAICDICKSEYGDFNANNHKGTTYVEGQKEATCYEEGYTGDKYCIDCHTKIESGKVIPKNAHNPTSVWSTDDMHHWKECQTVGCGNIINKAEHSGGEATCTNRAVCSVCGVEYGDLNPENHVGETEIKDDVEHTCITDGFTGNTYCKGCGAKIKNGDVIPAGHTLQKVDAKAATHDADGNIEYYVCTVCGKYFSDETAEDEITYEDTVTAKGKHNYIVKYDGENHWKECECGSITETETHTFGDWAIVQNATPSEKGVKEKICFVCGYKIDEEIPAISGDDDTINSGNQQNNDGPAESSKPNNYTSSPQTGDNSDITLWIALLAVSWVALTVAALFRRKRVR